MLYDQPKTTMGSTQNGAKLKGESRSGSRSALDEVVCGLHPLCPASLMAVLDRAFVRLVQVYRI